MFLFWESEEAVSAPEKGRRNRLLAALSPADRGLLQPSLQLVALQAHQVLEAAGVPILHVHFVEDGVVSVVATTLPHYRIEVGIVGYEGMTGLSAVLGDDRPANETVVQSAGSALRLPTAALREAMGSSRSLAAALLRYAHVFMMQSSQTALANGRGLLLERLARWLLMRQDRIAGADLVVTHEFLSILLGVRRPAVTVALHELEGKRLIRSNRNKIQILDRDGLKRAANGFYGIPEAEYDRSIIAAVPLAGRPPAPSRREPGTASRPGTV